MGTLRILLADDHTLVRQGLRKILEDRPSWHVVAEAADGDQAVRQAEQHKPDVAVIDVAMPLRNGIETTREIRRITPRTGILVLSMYADEAYVRQILDAGGTGYLLKDSADVDLLQAVGDVSQGKSFLSPAVARLMQDEYGYPRSDTAADRYGSLSRREREVFQLVAEGKSNKQIVAC
jgi:DNA-binding NarL/FixJ family response regulator